MFSLVYFIIIINNINNNIQKWKHNMSSFIYFI